MSASFPNLNALWADQLMAALVANGVEAVCLSPGSRSTPLAIAAHSRPDLRDMLHFDERSSAFFALGLARATDRPVALVCTSGTAAANFHPAIVEAAQTQVPLIVLTADRPPRLRGLGAAQTIDQIHLYGPAVQHFQDLPLPVHEPDALRAVGYQVALAVAKAQASPRGPVHLNVPFDEPLAPVPQRIEDVQTLAATRPAPPRIRPARAIAEAEALAEAEAMILPARRPVVIAGPHAADDAIAGALLRWAQSAGAPIVADVGSGLRGKIPAGSPICCHGDAFLRWDSFMAAAPDLLIRLGASPTARGTLNYLQKHRVSAIALAGDLWGRDPEAIASLVVAGEPADTFSRLAVPAQPDADWLPRWREAEEAVSEAIAHSRVPVPQEALAVREAVRALPHGAQLCLSNSLPIRHADTFLGQAPGIAIRVFRGANGIDGVTSTSLGLACGSDRPTLLVTGDLAFLHDLGGLHAARYLDRPFVILLLNNDGGGIFSYLPIAEATNAFEPLFGTPHGLDFAPAAQLFGAPHVACDRPDEVAAAVTRSLGRKGLSVIEFRSDRRETAESHRAFQAASRGLRAEAAR